MRRLGFNLENTDKPNNWVLVNKRKFKYESGRYVITETNWSKNKKEKKKKNT